MVGIFVCRICGDPYIREEVPSGCAHCGAYSEFLVPAKEYKNEFNVELNDLDRENAEKALEIEVSNAEFYFCAAEKAESLEHKKLFNALGKVEAEHASVWAKILDTGKKIGTESKCFPDAEKNLEESHKREDRAIKFYAKAAGEAESKRVKEIFEALVDVEKDHLEFSE